MDVARPQWPHSSPRRIVAPLKGSVVRFWGPPQEGQATEAGVAGSCEGTLA